MPNSKRISEIRIHPANPDVAYVAVQGALHGPSEDRGVYRTMDGGKSWEKILYVDEQTGAADLSMDAHNPRILYASMWYHIRYPWTMISGGADKTSAIYKSIDGGETWEKLTKGLPPHFGKSAVDVSPANSEIVYANIEAEGSKGGVYRSDDGGNTWRQTTSDRTTITRAWYYIEIFADPQDQETVYVLNAPMLKSIDGGKSFKSIPNPHSDAAHLSSGWGFGDGGEPTRFQLVAAMHRHLLSGWRADQAVGGWRACFLDGYQWSFLTRRWND